MGFMIFALSQIGINDCFGNKSKSIPHPDVVVWMFFPRKRCILVCKDGKNMASETKKLFSGNCFKAQNNYCCTASR